MECSTSRWPEQACSRSVSPTMASSHRRTSAGRPKCRSIRGAGKGRPGRSGVQHPPVPKGNYAVGVEALDGFPVERASVSLSALIAAIFGQLNFSESSINSREAAIEIRPGRHTNVACRLGMIDRADGRVNERIGHTSPGIPLPSPDVDALALASDRPPFMKRSARASVAHRHSHWRGQARDRRGHL